MLLYEEQRKKDMTFNGTTATVAVNTTTNDFASVSIDITSNNETIKKVVYPTIYDRWRLPI